MPAIDKASHVRTLTLTAESTADVLTLIECAFHEVHRKAARGELATALNQATAACASAEQHFAAVSQILSTLREG